MIDLTIRERAVLAFAEVIATSESDVDTFDRKLLRLRELLEDWHEAVLLGDGKAP